MAPRLELLAAVTLLFEWVSAHVVAVILPEARRVLRHEFEAAYPLNAFPRIELRHHEPQWIPVIRRKRLAIVFEREQGRRPHQIIQGHVGRIALLREYHHVFR